MNETPKRVVVLVAHPDDEIIWCGGFILQHPTWDWTVLSLCRADDADRAPKFHRVCGRLGAKGIISTLDDGNPPADIDGAVDIGGRIEQLLPPGEWDLCLTHGPGGEYGHLRHRQVHAEVMRLVGAGALVCGELWTFAYACEAPSGRCEPADDADVRIDLTDEQLRTKKEIVQFDYGYGPESFEVTACISPESFRLRTVPIEETQP